jgi:hypothetical protein
VLAPVSDKSPLLPLGIAHFSDLIRNGGRSFSGYERNRMYANLGEGRFADAGAVLGVDLIQDGRGVAAGDLDGDGDLDLAVSNRNSPRLAVLENVAPRRGNALRVRLQGDQSNWQGIGAVLTLEAGARRQVRVIQAGGGFVSQSPAEAWFGLGEEEAAERLTVVWPSGKTESWPGLPAGAGRVRVLVEGEGEAADGGGATPPAGRVSPGGSSGRGR